MHDGDDLGDDTGDAGRIRHRLVIVATPAAARAIRSVGLDADVVVPDLALVAEEYGSLDGLRAACGRTALLAAVGPVCAEVARQLELRGVVMPERFRIAPMIGALAEALHRRAPGTRRRRPAG